MIPTATFAIDRPAPGVAVVTPTGSFDVYSATDGRSLLLDAVNEGRYRQVVDLSGVDFIDSTGLAVIVGPEEPCNGYDVEEQIKTLVGLFAEGHEFAGFVQEDPDPGFGEPPHRWVVRGGVVVKESPVITWPEGAAA